MTQYGTVNYGMGDTAMTDADKSRTALRKIKRSLKGWLKKRKANDEVLAGKRKAKLPPRAAAAGFARDWDHEQKLASQLHALLSETVDSKSLPFPDVQSNPNSAVELAQIVVEEKLPMTSDTPEAQGIVWFIPVIIGGVALLTVTSWISNAADVAKHKEEIECIKMGACTDYGFWFKVGAVGVVAWLAWDKLGGKKFAKKLGV